MPHMKTQCWVWTAKKFHGGYGRIRIGSERKTAIAHRAAWFLHYGRWPEPFALHRCDNPSCVRWDHLFEGDHIVNQKDKLAKGRQAKGERHGSSKLTEREVLLIRKSYPAQGPRALARKFKVSRILIQLIVKHKIWKNI